MQMSQCVLLLHNNSVKILHLRHPFVPQKNIHSAYRDKTVTYRNKKLRCREQHSASVMLSWCTL